MRLLLKCLVKKHQYIDRLTKNMILKYMELALGEVEC